MKTGNIQSGLQGYDTFVVGLSQLVLSSEHTKNLEDIGGKVNKQLVSIKY